MNYPHIIKIKVIVNQHHIYDDHHHHHQHHLSFAGMQIQ